ncbi:fructan beta-fructosidase [Saonia flava]|uniref:Fructan beta-fructosidase n=1 Tax=Saonia flava TaxID=523696 RepID=A0A846R3D8_9FLAO|nr:glycoside hydrolase family 32 protein [Saonia flava]NJB71874.1 fructan beta-fructosidase [Saonia flava]
MKQFLRNFAILLLCIICFSCKEEKQQGANEKMTKNYQEDYRPQFHFSPEEKWMNDPNGLVYHEGVYHLFYQYYPNDIVWGPMHWGHAVSEDMIHWEHKPIALFPDEHGLIFSGSAVVDVVNSSGLGTIENPPLVAIFTYHLMEAEEASRNDYQTQGIAYSLDNGDTWTKYKGNPVIKNDGIKDFRDPKVFWNNITEEWTMLLVAGDHLQIWSSENLIDWKKESEFGKNQGAHGGVWECPDIFPLKVEGTEQEKWVLLISINPGAPNGGSGTQYFIGDFDGTTFTSEQKEHRWIDWGTDNYAGVTYNNVPNNDRIFIGWMSNWDYAQDIPTERWRSSMTVPRKLSLKKIGEAYELVNYPLESFDGSVEKGTSQDFDLDIGKEKQFSFENFNQSEVKFTTSAKSFNLIFKNEKNEELVLLMDNQNQLFSIDRSKSGKIDFKESFGKTQNMPIPNLPKEAYEVRILMDWSSIEVFINKGQYVMTAQIFPNEDYTNLIIENTSEDSGTFKDFEINKVKSIW